MNDPFIATFFGNHSLLLDLAIDWLLWKKKKEILVLQP
jgi:hypothetical protein